MNEWDITNRKKQLNNSTYLCISVIVSNVFDVPSNSWHVHWCNLLVIHFLDKDNHMLYLGTWKYSTANWIIVNFSLFLWQVKVVSLRNCAKQKRKINLIKGEIAQSWLLGRGNHIQRLLLKMGTHPYRVNEPVKLQYPQKMQPYSNSN